MCVSWRAGVSESWDLAESAIVPTLFNSTGHERPCYTIEVVVHCIVYSYGGLNLCLYTFACPGLTGEDCGGTIDIKSSVHTRMLPPA